MPIFDIDHTGPRIHLGEAIFGRPGERTTHTLACAYSRVKRGDRASITAHAMSSATMAFPFPSADPDTSSVASSTSPQPLTTHLPFRRISLPATPNINLNRQSVVSLASFESLSEHGPSRSSIASPTKKSQSRRTLEARRKGARRRGYRAPDEDAEAKRRKVIEEFYETERTYVQGLDLIYEVSSTCELCYDPLR